MIRGYYNKIAKPTITNVPNKMFNSMFKKSLGKDIWGFLCEDLTIIRMIDAANLRRPSVEPISNDLYQTFKSDFDKRKPEDVDRWKQFIGYMTKFIMEENGYIHDGRNFEVKFGNFFNKATRYKKFN